jgi:hypothetical protein
MPANPFCGCRQPAESRASPTNRPILPTTLAGRAHCAERIGIKRVWGKEPTSCINPKTAGRSRLVHRIRKAGLSTRAAVSPTGSGRSEHASRTAHSFSSAGKPATGSTRIKKIRPGSSGRVSPTPRRGSRWSPSPHWWSTRTDVIGAGVSTRPQHDRSELTPECRVGALEVKPADLAQAKPPQRASTRSTSGLLITTARPTHTQFRHLKFWLAWRHDGSPRTLVDALLCGALGTR